MGGKLKNYIGLSATDQQCCSRRLSKGLHAKSMAWLWLYQGQIIRLYWQGPAYPARPSRLAAGQTRPPQSFRPPGSQGRVCRDQLPPSKEGLGWPSSILNSIQSTSKTKIIFFNSNDFYIYLTAIIICKWVVIG